MNSFTLKLPFPPSVNHYWQHRARATFISDEGAAFRKEVWAICHSMGLSKGSGANLKLNLFDKRLAVTVDLYPPDNRRRDIDNYMKGLLDSLKYGGVYKDDSQIDDLHIVRKQKHEGGLAFVTVKTLT